MKPTKPFLSYLSKEGQLCQFVLTTSLILGEEVVDVMWRMDVVALLVVIGSNNVGLSNANIGENPMPPKPKDSFARFIHGGFVKA